jgi:hypothetical protein
VQQLPRSGSRWNSLRITVRRLPAMSRSKIVFSPAALFRIVPISPGETCTATDCLPEV